MKKFYKTYRYWIFALVGGILLIFWEDEQDIEPIYSISAFIYWSLLIFWGARWIFKQVRATIRLKKEKAEMEIMHLQSQVNPHFFFNMLNNLYGLVGQDSDKAQQLILKLSDLMRYSIYDGQEEFVTLKEEIDYLKNYISLHQMRYHKKIKITFEKEILDTQFQVKPLLFIILLENAFKHGVEKLTEGAFINVSLAATDKDVFFKVENNFDPTQMSDDGIGLTNLKRRLELLYPSRHELSFSEENNIFDAELTLKNL